MKSTVYFTKDLSPKGVKRIFEKLNPTLGNKIAIKLHSGEEGNQNFLGPDFWEELIDSLNGVVVECNTAYPGARNTTKKHRQLIGSPNEVFNSSKEKTKSFLNSFISLDS